MDIMDIVKEAVLIFISVCSVSLGLMFLSYYITRKVIKIREVNKKSGNSGRKSDEATAIQDYPESGAIAKAKELSSQNLPFCEEASQFGLHLMPWDEDEYRKIRDRLFSNNKLASTLRTVDQEGILVVLGNKFQVHTKAVGIDINATDDEIIKFLVDSLPVAKARKASFEESEKEASQFGLHLMPWEEDEYRQIRNRLLTNDQLASALKTAAREEIDIVLSHDFQVEADAIDINVNAPDDEIIKFLLGK